MRTARRTRSGRAGWGESSGLRQSGRVLWIEDDQDADGETDSRRPDVMGLSPQTAAVERRSVAGTEGGGRAALWAAAWRRCE